MLRGIAVLVVAGIVFAGLGTSEAQESDPRPAVVEASPSATHDTLEPGLPFRLGCVAGLEGDIGVTIAIAPRQGIDSPQPKRRKRFAGAVRLLLELVASVGQSVRAGNE